MVNSDARARPTTQVARLLAAGAEPNTTALCAAAFSGHLEVARLLLEAGADPGCADNDGTTPLMDAAGLVTR